MDFTFKDPRVLSTATLIHKLSKDLKRLQADDFPSQSELQDAPEIRGWSLGYRFEPALIGLIAQHPLLADGPVTTSSLYYLDPEAGFARTMSRFYRLGDPSAGR